MKPRENCRPAHSFNRRQQSSGIIPSFPSLASVKSPPISTPSRILLGLIFLVFPLDYWLQFLPIPGQPEGSHGANFMGAVFAK